MDSEDESENFQDAREVQSPEKHNQAAKLPSSQSSPIKNLTQSDCITSSKGNLYTLECRITIMSNELLSCNCSV